MARQAEPSWLAGVRHRQWTGLGLGKVVLTDSRVTLGHHHRAQVGHDLVAVLIEATGAHADDAHSRTRRTFSLVQADALGVNRVADVHGMSEPNVSPPEIRYGVLTHVDDRQTQHQGHRQAGVHDDAPARDGVRGGQVSVEMVLIGIARQLSEPGGVGLGNGAPKRVLIHIANLEVVEEPAENGGVCGHGSLRCGQGIPSCRVIEAPTPPGPLWSTIAVPGVDAPRASGDNQDTGATTGVT